MDIFRFMMSNRRTVAESAPATILWHTPSKPENISVGRGRVASHLRDMGHTVTVRGTTLDTLRRSIRERGEYDVILGTTRSGAMAGTAIAALTAFQTPFVVDHIDPIDQFKQTDSTPLYLFVRAMETLAFATANHTLFVYDRERSRVARWARDYSQTALGVDFERFQSPPEETVRLASEYIPEDVSNLAVYVGGLEPIYNLDVLLDATDHFPDEWGLLIAGEGSLTEDVAERARDSDAVTFAGPLPHELIPGILHHADVGVSLVQDAHTLKVLEYGAAGLTIVQAATPESILDGFANIVNLDPEAVADAITGEGPEYTADPLARDHDWKRIAQQYDTTIQTVVQ